MPLVCKYVLAPFLAAMLAAVPGYAKDIEAPLDTLGLPELAERPAYLERLHYLLVAVDGEPVVMTASPSPPAFMCSQNRLMELVLIPAVEVNR